MHFQAKVEFDYAPQPENVGKELVLRQGDIVTIKDSSQQWWLAQKQDGTEGYIPSNYVTKIPGGASFEQHPYMAAKYPGNDVGDAIQQLAGLDFNATPQAPPAGASAGDNISSVGKAKVTYDYQKQRDDEMDLKKQELVHILKQEDDGWWMGRIHREVRRENGTVDNVWVNGWFPSNFVEAINDQEFEQLSEQPSITTVNQGPEPLHWVRTLFDFPQAGQRAEAGELSFKADSLLEIIEKPPHAKDWWRARNAETMQTGLIPANHVEVLPGRPDESNVNGSSFQAESSLEGRPCFKGPIGRVVAENMLEVKSPGTWLVRSAESCPRNDQYSISVRAAGDRVRHFRLTFTNGKFNIGTNQFNSFDQLIHHYTFNPIFKKDNELLKLVEHVRDSS